LFFADLPSDDTSIDDCQETIFLESGCEIVNRRCRCWNGMEVCRDKNLKWDFKNLEVSIHTVYICLTFIVLEIQLIEPRGTSKKISFSKKVLINLFLTCP
jgi:hypothetical protein